VTCSARCTSSALALLLFCGCASARVPAEARPAGARYAVFPLMNYSGGAAPAKEVRGAFEDELRSRGVELVDDAEVEAFLARHRLRWVGGIDGQAAAAARDELKADGIVLASIDLWRGGGFPRLAVTARLVSTGEKPELLWMDSVSRAGDESPGAFDLGLIEDPAELGALVLDRLAGSLSLRLSGQSPRAAACDAGARFDPSASFRSPLLDPSKTWKVAVLPFLNETSRRSAGDLVALTFMRQLSALPSYTVVDPGAIREQLLRFRITAEQGVSLDDARVLLELVNADLVLTGIVHQFDDGSADAVPRVQFSAMLLERQNDEIVWQSTSASTGRDGVFFFDAGAVGTPGDLTCRMVQRVVQRMVDASRNTPLRALH
jgi:hypothetical protein